MHRSLMLAIVTVIAASGPALGIGQAAEPVDCTFPVTVVDGTGESVTVATPPEEVVVLGPSAAQTLWAIGARELVVGLPINRYTAYLPDREGRTNVVGEDGKPIPETVVNLDPDLVFAPNIITNETVNRLREAGLTVYRFRPATSLPDVYRKIQRTGRLVGEAEAATAVSASLRGNVTAVRSAVDGTPRPRVYYALGGGWTAGTGTFIDALIDAAGGTNVAALAGIEGYKQLSTEVVVARDPAVVVLHEERSVADIPGLENASAVSPETVVHVNPNFINQPGPRNVEPLVKLATAFHHDAMQNATLAATPADTPVRCAATPTQTATAAGGVGPGLTPLVGFVALALLTVLGLRRS